ncbi:cytochrome P450 [Ramaria rubella]|nr:cytochrome P450 [Ramaria rubella]
MSLEWMPGYMWAGFALLVVTIVYTTTRPKDHYASIPTVGRSGAASYLDVFHLVRNANVMLLKGYSQFKGGVFRLPDMNRWYIMVCGKKHVEELSTAPEELLSLKDVLNEILARDYTFGPSFVSDMYHIDVIRIRLTRNLVHVFPQIRDEAVRAFDDYIPVTDDWAPANALGVTMKIVSRISNRIFIGAPTCRNPEYIKLNLQFTTDVIVGAAIIGLCPNFLKPFAGRWFTNVPRAIRTALKHLGPIIEERQRNIDKYGFDYPDKPNDFLSWLMEEATDEQRTTRNLTLRILSMNFMAIHNASLTFAHALLHLASRSEYIAPLRAEVEAIIAEHGWTKVAMSRLRKLDSFLKESQRMDGLGGITLPRRAMKEFTFSDGTLIPEGGFVCAVATALHRDEDIYTDAETFNGFRFSDMREGEGEGLKNQLTATSSEFIAFGHGKQACPGRFFAANELKVMMTHLLLSYDIKMENEGVRPKNQWLAIGCRPNPKAEVLFRKRRT